MNRPPLPHASSLFRGRHFDRTFIVLCVRWYITYKLSYRDLVGMMAERGVDVSHTTILVSTENQEGAVRHREDKQE